MASPPYQTHLVIWNPTYLDSLDEHASYAPTAGSRVLHGVFKLGDVMIVSLALSWGAAATPLGLKKYNHLKKFHMIQFYSHWVNWLKVFGTKIVDNWWIIVLVNGVIINYRPHACQTLSAFCCKNFQKCWIPFLLLGLRSCLWKNVTLRGGHCIKLLIF